MMDDTFNCRYCHVDVPVALVGAHERSHQQNGTDRDVPAPADQAMGQIVFLVACVVIGLVAGFAYLTLT